MWEPVQNTCIISTSIMPLFTSTSLVTLCEQLHILICHFHFQIIHSYFKIFKVCNEFVCVCAVTKLCLSLLLFHGLQPTRPLCPWDFPGILGFLEWVAISFSRGSSQPRDQTHISCLYCIGRWILPHWATWEAYLINPFESHTTLMSKVEKIIEISARINTFQPKTKKLSLSSSS